MIDVTDKVEFGNPDDDVLPITKCVCGFTFKPWEFIIGMFPDVTYKCGECGRTLCFSNKITVYEVDEKDSTAACDPPSFTIEWHDVPTQYVNQTLTVEIIDD